MKSDKDTKPTADIDATDTQLVWIAPDRRIYGHEQADAFPGKFPRLPTAVAAIMAVLIALDPWPALPQAVELVIVDVTTVAKGYRASKLTGRGVVNEQNERIGTIDDITIGRDRVLFAILQVGGFLGVGGQLVAVPYQSLVLDQSGEKISLPGATREQLKKLPEFKHRS